MGAGGGQGDLDQIHELELNDIAAIGNLMDLCNSKFGDDPTLLQKVINWLTQSVKQGGRNVRIDTTAFFNALYHDDDATDSMEDIPIDRLVNALEKLVADAPVADEPPLSQRITFPYSRHSSLSELQALVDKFRPRAVFPNTETPGLDMNALFGHLLLDRAGEQSRQAASDDPVRTVEDCRIEGAETVGLQADASKIYQYALHNLSSQTQTSGSESTRSEKDAFPKAPLASSPGKTFQAKSIGRSGSLNDSGPTMISDDKIRANNDSTKVAGQTEESETKPRASKLDAYKEKRKRKHSTHGKHGSDEDGNENDDVADAAARRLRAFEAAMGADDRAWATDVSLSSVTGGYHNEEKEVEL